MTRSDKHVNAIPVTSGQYIWNQLSKDDKKDILQNIIRQFVNQYSKKMIRHILK